jgi:hypothetical protein
MPVRCSVLLLLLATLALLAAPAVAQLPPAPEPVRIATDALPEWADGRLLGLAFPDSTEADSLVYWRFLEAEVVQPLDLIEAAPGYRYTLTCRDAQTGRFAKSDLCQPPPDTVRTMPLPGSGTLADPYLIDSVADFDEIRNDVTAHYRLVADVDFAGGGIPTIEGFSGSLDGAGHVLRNYSWDHYAYDGNRWQTGLFGGVVTAHIHDLGVEDAYSRGGRRSGILVAQLHSPGLIERVYITGEMVSVRHEFGAVAGYVDTGAAIRDCWVDAYVWGDETENAASQGGGIVGHNASGSDATVTRCLFLGTVDTGSTSANPGEDAPIVSNGEASDSYYDSTVYPNPSTPSAGSTGLSTADLQSGNPTLTPELGTPDWTFEAGQYPRLSWQPAPGGGSSPIELGAMGSADTGADAALALERLVAAAAAGSTQAHAALAVARTITAEAGAQSGTDAALQRLTTLTAAADGEATVDAAVHVARLLEATTDADAGATAALLTTSTLELAATAAGVAQAEATLTTRRLLAAETISEAGAVAAAYLTRRMAGTAAADSGATAGLVSDARLYLVAEAEATSTASAGLRAARAVGAEAAGESAAAVSLQLARFMSALAGGSASAEAALDGGYLDVPEPVALAVLPRRVRTVPLPRRSRIARLPERPRLVALHR